MQRGPFTSTIASIAFSIAVAAGGLAMAGSETPPAGAPWQRSFDAVHREALKSGKPIFIYFTKTY